jgi:hypothetical protein
VNAVDKIITVAAAASVVIAGAVFGVCVYLELFG